MRKPVLRRGRTIWLGRTTPATRYPTLRGHHETEVAIVGGGMTFAALAARILVEQWQGIRSKDHDLFAFNRFSAS